MLADAIDEIAESRRGGNLEPQQPVGGRPGREPHVPCPGASWMRQHEARRTNRCLPRSGRSSPSSSTGTTSTQRGPTVRGHRTL